MVVPLHFVLSGDTVFCHLAKPNPIWSAIEENDHVVLAVIANYAYVPAAWKAIGDEDPALGIPTSYYSAVQLVCHAEVVEDGNEKIEILRMMLEHFEPDSGVADPAVHVRQLPAIKGLRLHIQEVRAKFKYGNNVDDAHRLAVADHLSQRNGPGDMAARRHILERMTD